MHPKEAAVLALGQKADGSRLRNADLQLITTLDKEGFFIAVSDQGDIVGTIGAMCLTDDLGFIGFYHVTDEFEDTGIQEKLWEKALNHLGDRNVGIEVAASDVQELQELGFKEEWRNGRFQGMGVELPREILVNQAIKPLEGMAMGKVVDFDTTATGIHKVPVVLGWCKGSTGYAAVEQGEALRNK